MDEILKRNLDAAIDAAIAEQRVVGTVVVVLRDGAPIYRRAAGFADRETRAPNATCGDTTGSSIPCSAWWW